MMTLLKPKDWRLIGFCALISAAEAFTGPIVHHRPLWVSFAWTGVVLGLFAAAVCFGLLIGVALRRGRRGGETS